MRAFSCDLRRRDTYAFDRMLGALHKAVKTYGAQTTTEKRGLIDGRPAVQWFGELYGEKRVIECRLNSASVDVFHTMEVHSWGSVLRDIFTRVLS